MNVRTMIAVPIANHSADAFAKHMISGSSSPPPSLLFTVPIAQGSADRCVQIPREDSQEEQKRLKRERRDNEPFLFRNKMTTRVKEYSISLPSATVYSPTNVTKKRKRKRKKK